MGAVKLAALGLLLGGSGLLRGVTTIVSGAVDTPNAGTAAAYAGTDGSPEVTHMMFARSDDLPEPARRTLPRW